MEFTTTSSSSPNSAKSTLRKSINSSLFPYTGAAGSLMNLVDDASSSTSSNPNTDNLHASSRPYLTSRDSTISSHMKRQAHKVKHDADAKSRQQSLLLMTFALILYLVGSVSYFVRYFSWNIRESLYFLVYTVTTVGYGTAHDIPRGQHLAFLICFTIVLGLGLWFLLFQLCNLYFVRFEFFTSAYDDTAYIAARGLEVIQKLKDADADPCSCGAVNDESERDCSDVRFAERIFNDYGNGKVHTKMFKLIEAIRSLCEILCNSMLIKFVGLLCAFIGILALVVGANEGWSVMKSIYFSVITLTTIGYGDVVAMKESSIWFLIFYLPLANHFFGIYIIYVAGFYDYIYSRHLERTTARLESNAKSRREGDLKEQEKAHNPKFDSTPPIQATRIFSRVERTKSLIYLKAFILKDEVGGEEGIDDSPNINRAGDEEQEQLSKLRLNVLTQERLNYIIATELIECISLTTKGDISIMADDFYHICSRWLIPKNAWEAYQDAAIRIILLAGKFNIQKNGREYLNRFNSVQLSNAYGPVILGMGGNGNQSDWLKATDDLCSIFSTTDSDETKSGDSS